MIAEALIHDCKARTIGQMPDADVQAGLSALLDRGRGDGLLIEAVYAGLRLLYTGSAWILRDGGRRRDLVAMGDRDETALLGAALGDRRFSEAVGRFCMVEEPLQKSPAISSIPVMILHRPGVILVWQALGQTRAREILEAPEGAKVSREALGILFLPGGETAHGRIDERCRAKEICAIANTAQPFGPDIRIRFDWEEVMTGW